MCNCRTIGFGQILRWYDFNFDIYFGIKTVSALQLEHDRSQHSISIRLSQNHKNSQNYHNPSNPKQPQTPQNPLNSLICLDPS